VKKEKTKKEIAIVVAAIIMLSVLTALPVISEIGEENKSIRWEANANVAESGQYRTFEDRINAVNCTSSSSADIVDTTATSDNIKLYLTKGYPKGNLTEYPELQYTSVRLIYDNGDNWTWGNYFLKGDITGASYSYRLYFASESSTTFKIEIIVNGNTVATFPLFAVPYDQYYQWFTGNVTGLDPTTSSGDEVIFKITKISGGPGKIAFAKTASYITIPPLAPQSIQLMEGDVTMDEHVTMADAMFIAQYKAGLRSLNASQLECADTTDDGDVTMADAMHIAQWKADTDGTLGVLFKPLWESPADDGMLEPVDC